MGMSNSSTQALYKDIQIALKAGCKWKPKELDGQWHANTKNDIIHPLYS